MPDITWTELWRLFHKRWGSDHESPEYVKKQWVEMQEFLEFQQSKIGTDVAAAVNKTLEAAEKIAYRFATHPAPAPMTEWARGSIQSARDIFFAIAALRNTGAESKGSDNA